MLIASLTCSLTGCLYKMQCNIFPARKLLANAPCTATGAVPRSTHNNKQALSFTILSTIFGFYDVTLSSTHLPYKMSTATTVDRMTSLWSHLKLLNRIQTDKILAWGQYAMYSSKTAESSQYVHRRTACRPLANVFTLSTWQRGRQQHGFLETCVALKSLKNRPVCY